MGVFRKGRDSDGNPTGAFYIQYPAGRDPLTGRIKYKTKRASWSKRKAEQMFRKKQDEFYERERLGVTVDPDLTFSQLMQWGLEQEVMKAKASYEDDIQRAALLNEYFGQLKACQINQLMVLNFRVEMEHTRSRRYRRKYQKATINRMVALARRVYNLGKIAGIVAHNPFKQLGVLKEHPRGRVLAPHELERLIAECPPYLVGIVYLGYYSGMRRGEIVNLTWDRVDMKRGLIDLSPEGTKTKDRRLIPFNDTLWCVFREANRIRSLSHNFVYTRKGKQIESFHTAFQGACKRAGIQNLRFHDLRHTFNTNMRKAGVDNTVIMKLTGHKTLSMFQRYNHVDEADAREAMRKLEGFLGASKEGAEGIVYSLSTPSED
jgi:integrase